ncbi:MAG: hypothetical protein CM1200mP2_39610 [Planctomycetaceae bacterium]|nr:MAG: hypothetical protein CM1200mP2_39610 [Planctomycetaceae bacterium]
MLSNLLGVSVHLIRRWDRAGLITPLRRVHRLPYFSFQDVASARRLSELLAQGVPRSEIERSLGQLAPLFRNGQRSIDQLEMLAHDSRIVFRDQHGLIEPASGQRLLGFDDDSQPTTEHVSEARSRLPMTDWSPSRPHEHWGFRDWFDQGRELLEEDAAEESIEAFRMCLMERPDEAEAHFHLAEALYRCGRSRAALERYHRPSNTTTGTSRPGPNWVACMPSWANTSRHSTRSRWPSRCTRTSPTHTGTRARSCTDSIVPTRRSLTGNVISPSTSAARGPRPRGNGSTDRNRSRHRHRRRSLVSRASESTRVPDRRANQHSLPPCRRSPPRKWSRPPAKN